MSKLKAEIVRRILRGGSVPSEKTLGEVLKTIAEEAPIVPRNIGKPGTVVTNPFTGNPISDVRLVKGVPYTEHFSTITVKGPGKYIGGTKKVHYVPSWQIEVWDEGTRKWEVVETFFPRGTKEPFTGKTKKESGHVEALEGLARWTSSLAGREADLARHIVGIRSPVIESNLNTLLLGLGGALGGGMAAAELLGPGEAEASPVGSLLKAGTKKAAETLARAAEAPVSRTAKDLVGKKLPAFGNRTIKNVTKGRGDWRYIIFDDDSVVPVTKDVLADLERAMGTEAKRLEFSQKQMFSHVAGVGSPLEQAYKSLAYHRSRQLPATVKNLEDYYKRYQQNLRDVGQEPPALAVVKEPGSRTPFTMPLFYAEVLEKEGSVKIIKRLK